MNFSVGRIVVVETQNGRHVYTYGSYCNSYLSVSIYILPPCMSFFCIAGMVDINEDSSATCLLCSRKPRPSSRSQDVTGHDDDKQKAKCKSFFDRSKGVTQAIRKSRELHLEGHKTKSIHK